MHHFDRFSLPAATLGLLAFMASTLASTGWCQEPEPAPLGGPELAAEQAPGDAAEEGPWRYWTTTWSFRDFDVDTLTRRLAAIGLELPVELAGTASVHFDVSIPLNGLRNPRAYRFQGTLSSERLTVDEVTLEDLVVSLNYVNGRVTLSDLRGRLREGSFTGRAVAELVPREGFEASLQLQQLDLAPIAEILAQFELGTPERLPQGRLNAELQASGRVETVTDPMTWEAEGQARVVDFAVGDSVPFSIVLDSFQWTDRRLSVPRLSMSSAAHPSFWMWLSGEVQLSEPLAFELEVQADDLPAEDLAKLWTDVPQRIIRGKLDLKGTAEGVVGSAADVERIAAEKGLPVAERAAVGAWNVELDVASPQLRLFGVELGLVQHQIQLTPQAFRLEPLVSLDGVPRARLKRLQADYRFAEQSVELSSLEADLFGGTIGGEATLAMEQQGRHSLALRWEHLRPSVRVPFGPLADPPAISGTSSGQIDWSVPAAELDRPASHRGTVAVNVSDLRLGPEVLGEVDLEASIDDAGFQLDGDGRLFGGSVRVRSTQQLEASTGWDDVFRSLSGGELEIRSVSLSQVIGSLPAAAEAPELSGQLDGSARLALDADGVMTTNSGWSVRNLAIGATPISRQIRMELVTEGSDVQVRSLRGSYAGGQVDASGRWSLARRARLLDMRFSGVDGARFLLPIVGPEAVPIGGRISGRATLTATGEGLFDAVRVSGAVRVREGVAWGVPVGDARGPMRFTFERDPTSWRVVFPRVRSDLAGGALEGNFSLASAPGARSGFRMDSRWRFNHVDFEDLLSTYVGGNTLGRGNVTGELRLSGRNIRGVQDLRGDFRARLGGTDATAVPAIASAASLLGPAALVGNRFTSGNLSGSIAGGAVQIGELSLRGEQMRVAAAGRVGLADGRMDLQAVIATGNFEAQNVALALLLERALVPVSAVATVNRIANDRTLVVNVAGTLGDPQLRVLAAPTIQANTRRILLRETIGLTLPESVWLATE